MKIRKYFFTIVTILLLSNFQLLAQDGIMVGPGRIYYKVDAGGTGTQKVTVTNPSDKAMDVGIAINDWAYNAQGDNLSFNPGTQPTTCADWIQISPGAFFTLPAKEKKVVSIMLNVPQNANKDIPVHTAMLYFTQLNPVDSKTPSGAMMKVSMRIGIKLYHSFSQQEERDIDITDFKDVADSTKASAGRLELAFQNKSKVWVEGKVNWELLNTQTGEKQKLEDLNFYSLPGDNRILKQPLPAKLAKGKYTATAIVNYGNKDELKIAELEFER